MARVRFTSMHHRLGTLTTVANRTFAGEHGGTMLQRVDDTDAERDPRPSRRRRHSHAPA
jgi:hypothetical protein